MIRFLYGDELSDYPVLADTMFRDRAQQFHRRLGWDVTLNESGWETDEYDALNPIYVIWEDEQGRHGGSMRTLPTTGRTMTADHFTHLTDGVAIRSPFIWECTRFCLASNSGAGVAAGLLMAGLEQGLRFGLDQALGVFDARMPRIYARLGHSPTVVGTSGTGPDAISVGLWEVSEQAQAEISRRCGIPVKLMKQWFDASFDKAPRAEARVA